MPEILLLLDGGESKIPAEPGETVLAACLRAGQKIQTVCKGRGICGACRILVDEGVFHRLAHPSANEERLLRYLKQSRPNHRLACQIVLDESLSGLRVKPDPLPVRTVTKES